MHASQVKVNTARSAKFIDPDGAARNKWKYSRAVHTPRIKSRAANTHVVVNWLGTEELIVPPVFG